MLIGKQDHIYDLYKQTVSTKIQETDKYCSHCGHEIYSIKDGSWIDELDPVEEEEKLLEKIELEIDDGQFLTHQRLFGQHLSLKEQQLNWDIKYTDEWNERHLFHKLYIQDQKRFLVYVEEIASMENPLEHHAVKELTNRRGSYRLKISPFVRAIFSLQRDNDRRFIRFLKPGREGDEYRTVNGKLWQANSLSDNCLKCGELYEPGDDSWADVLEPGLAEYLKDSFDDGKNSPTIPHEEVKEELGLK